MLSLPPLMNGGELRQNRKTSIFQYYGVFSGRSVTGFISFFIHFRAIIQESYSSWFNVESAMIPMKQTEIPIIPVEPNLPPVQPIIPVEPVVPAPTPADPYYPAGSSSEEEGGEDSESEGHSSEEEDEEQTYWNNYWNYWYNNYWAR